MKMRIKTQILLKNRVLRKIVGLEEKKIKQKEENCIMSNFVIFIPPKTQQWTRKCCRFYERVRHIIEGFG